MFSYFHIPSTSEHTWDETGIPRSFSFFPIKNDLDLNNTTTPNKEKFTCVCGVQPKIIPFVFTSSSTGFRATALLYHMLHRAVYRVYMYRCVYDT